MLQKLQEEKEKNSTAKINIDQLTEETESLKQALDAARTEKDQICEQKDAYMNKVEMNSNGFVNYMTLLYSLQSSYLSTNHNVLI